VAEGVVLGVCAAPAGLLFGLWCLALLRALGAADVPRIDEIRLDASAAAFAGALSLLAGAVLAAAPAALALRTRISGSLAESARAVAGGRATERLRAAVVVAQVALAVILLVGATLLLHSFRRLSQVSLGFEPGNAVAVQVPLPPARYGPGEGVGFFDALLMRIRALPGVDAAGAVTSVPFGGQSSSNLFFPDHMVFARRDEAPDADYRVITPGYLDALGLRLVRGRDFEEQDRARGDVALISETMAARYWRDRDPIGQRFRFGGADGRHVTIVGVVGDARYQSVEAPDVRPMMYFVHSAAAPAETMTLVVRSSLPSEQLFAGVRSTLAALDPELAIALATTVDDLVEGVFAQPRFHAALFGLFATLALVLSGVGLYAVIAYAVAQRTREIGVRVALGARRRHLVAMVCSGGLRLVAIGLLAGITAALWLTRVLRALLFQTSPREPAAFLAVVALLAVVAAVACWLPARRAARLDPVAALRA
jgi:predicted permease